MPAPFPARRLHGLAAALAVAAAVAAAPGRAAAECGDYVHVANQPTAGELPHPAPKPCDGPSCSGSPATPVLPVTAPTGESSRGHEWAATAEPVAPTAANGHGRLVPADAAVPAHVPQPIFHPPRGR